MDRERLMSYGIDYDQGLKNCMGNVAFYKKILSMFLEDACFTQAKSAYMNKDQKELFLRMHELKGISANAALVALYEASVPLVEVLRSSNNMDAETDRLFALAETAYNRAREGVTLINEEL